MATRFRRRLKPGPRLRFDPLEPREAPAATRVIDFAAGFTEDRMPGGIPDGYANRVLLLTDGRNILSDGRDQARAVFAPTRVDVRAFQTSFVFRVEERAGPMGDGFTFALTGDDRQAIQTAGGGTGEGLGYLGLTDSVAVKFDLVDNAGEGPNSVGVFTGGAAPTGPAVSLEGTGIDLHSGHSYRADITYDGQTLTLSLTDTFDPARTWTHAFPVDIPAGVGSDTAYAGFTAGTGMLFARQAISSWTYAEVSAEAPANRPPVIFTPANASWLAPDGAVLGVGATDDGGPGNLTYTWEAVFAPPGAAPQIRPMFGDGSASVSLNGGGRYTFRVTVRDSGGLTATSDVSYTDPLSVPGFEVSAGSPTVRAGEAVQFQTLVPDAAGHLTPENLLATWRVVSGPGTIDRSGRYTAPVDARGPVTVRAEIPGMYPRYGLYWRSAETTVTVVGPFEGADLSENGSARVTDGVLRLTDGPHQAGSAYAAEPVDVRGFTTSFWFRIGERLDYWYGDGLTFILQNAGPVALGRAGGGLGYEGIGQSVAVKFDVIDNTGETPHSVGLYTNGATPTLPADPLPPNPPGQGTGGILLNRGHVFRADLAYADGALTLRLWDTVTGHGFGRTYAVDLPAAVGSDTAYAGFTAGTGERFAPIDILKWTFTPADDSQSPPPTDDGAPALAVEVRPDTGVITTVAGTGVAGYGGDGGPAAAAALTSPQGVAVDAAGNVYFADQDNQRVRKVDAATGVITTVAGTGALGFGGDGGPATSALLYSPTGVAVDTGGNLFVVDQGNQRVRRVDAVTGVITTVAGNGSYGYAGDGGPATSASLTYPLGVAVDAAGNVYIADTYSSRVRRVDAVTGVITTVAGTGAVGYGGDGGPAADAPLRYPAAVAVDAAGNLYIADQGDHRVRRVDAGTGAITTVAGTGVAGFSGEGGPAADAMLRNPYGVALDPAGNLFIVDQGNHRVRRVDAATGIIATVVGNGTRGYSGDGGPATGTALNDPFGVAVDGAGNLFVTDRNNSRVRKVTVASPREGAPAAYTFSITNTSPAGTDPVTVTSVVDTLLGGLTAAARAANGGAEVVLAPHQTFTFPYVTRPQNAGPVAGTVTVSGRDDEGTLATASASHTLTVADVAPSVAVGVLVSTGTISTVAGTGFAGYGGDGGAAADASLSNPHGVAADAAGNVYIADQFNHRVRRVDAVTGVITTVAGTGAAAFGGDGGPAASALLWHPRGLAVDAAGNLFIADGNNNRVRRVDAATGVITTVAGTGTHGYGGDGGPATAALLANPLGVAVDAAGNLYIADNNNNRIRKVDAGTGVITTLAGTRTYAASSGDGGPATDAFLGSPVGLAADAAGNVYIADTGNHRVRRVDAATGVITTVAGTGAHGVAGDGGPATAASLSSPWGVAVDGTGNLYVADQFNHRVRRVDAATGVITAVAGTGAAGYGGDGGPAAAARIASPQGVGVDAAGNVYIADTGNHRVRKVAVGAILEGDPAAYTFTITNTSPASTDPVTVTSVVDDALGDLTAAAVAANGGRPIVLAPGPGQTFTFIHATAALNAGPVAGTVTVTGRDDEGTPATATATHTLTVQAVDPAIAVDVAIGTGTITTVAGNGGFGFGGDGGPAAGTPLAYPYGVAVDATGNLFIADSHNQRVRRVDAATGFIATVAGTGTDGYGGDGGPATAALLRYPAGAAVDAAGNLFIADTNNHRVRKVDAATGVITTLAGTGTPGYGGDGGPAASAVLAYPYGVAVDAAGNLFIADTNNNRVRRVDAATGAITTVAGNGSSEYAGDGGPATSASLFGFFGVAVDAAGNLFIADRGNERVRRVDAVTGVITTVAGTGTQGYAGDGGPATSARLYLASGVAVDAAGNLFIADTNNNRVRRVDAATGVITTVAGTGAPGYAGDGGPATGASLFGPFGLATDAAGNLFIGDTSNNRVRRVGAGAILGGTPVAYTFALRNTSPASTDPVTVALVMDDGLGDLTPAARAANGGADVVLAPGQSFTFEATGPAFRRGTVVTVTALDDEGTVAVASDAETLTVN